MATIYVRKNRWWISWIVDGHRFSKSTGLLLEDEAKARDVKARLERQLELDKALDSSARVASRVFAGYRKQWIADRRRQEIGSVNDEENWLRHASELDTLKLLEIRPRHVRDVILRLKRERHLAPRSIRHVFGLLHKLFNDAFIEELVPANPCVLPKGVLPGKQDKDPTWRALAIYSRAEVEQLISDPVIPQVRRALYAILFFTGMRIGEVAALRWRNYEPKMEPLGRLLVSQSFSRKLKKVKGVKTEQPRQAPVHPVLSKALAAWKLGGWAEHIGKPPKEDDLIIPTERNTHLKDDGVHASLQLDLKKLGHRPRRTHDARRTFISLALADGARKDILRWVTHGPSGDIMDSYTTLPWATLCAEVARLNVRILDAATPLLHLPTAKKVSE